jgi:hypothetical protein
MWRVPSEPSGIFPAECDRASASRRISAARDFALEALGASPIIQSSVTIRNGSCRLQGITQCLNLRTSLTLQLPLSNPKAPWLILTSYHGVRGQ